MRITFGLAELITKYANDEAYERKSGSSFVILTHSLECFENEGRIQGKFKGRGYRLSNSSIPFTIARQIYGSMQVVQRNTIDITTYLLSAAARYPLL